MLSKTVVFLLFVCLRVIHCFRSKNFGSAPVDPSNDEENVYPCYRDVNCALGSEGREKANECYGFLSKENLKMGIGWLEESSKMAINKKDRDGAIEQFCEMEENPRQETFVIILKKIIDLLSIECHDSTREPKPICEEWNGLTECYVTIIQEYSEKGLCGADVDAKRKAEGFGSSFKP